MLRHAIQKGDWLLSGRIEPSGIQESCNRILEAPEPIIGYTERQSWLSAAWELRSRCLKDQRRFTEILRSQQEISEICVIRFDFRILTDGVLQLDYGFSRRRRKWGGPALLSQHHEQQKRGRHYILNFRT